VIRARRSSPAPRKKSITTCPPPPWPNSRPSASARASTP
jgi:hypothetical protein